MIIFIPIIALIVGVSLGFVSRWVFVERRTSLSRKYIQEISEKAEKEADAVRKEAQLQAKEILLNARTVAEREDREKKQEVQRRERRIQQKEEQLDRKLNNLERKESELRNKEKSLVAVENANVEKGREYDALIKETKSRLEKISGITAEEAKKLLIEMVENEAKLEASKRVKEIEQAMAEEANRKAQDIIALAIQKYAADYTAEHTVTVVNLPNDEMKGKIIGREGRNIRTIEAATGVEIIVDDTPGSIVVSGHNPVKREIARMSLERLISDGRIHPGRIEDIVAKTTKELENSLKEAGEKAVFDLDIHGIHPELVKLIGKLKYRTSYSQNVYQHSLEVAFMTGVMAAELGLNIKQARRAGLLHDIGKAVDHEVEGPHAQIGADLAKKFGESVKIVEAISGHHDDRPGNIMATLIQSADAMSSARPGARKETMEAYVKRVEELEKIAASFPGVEKAFAIQAGRELRVIVQPEKVSDSDAVMLSQGIAKQVQAQMTYPGQIKVTVIRETRAVELAK